jgi:isopentenyl-diphosphate delta-isomerase
MVKETGAGISSKTAKRLSGIGIKGIDIAGMGGTSFAAVEMYRAGNRDDKVKMCVGTTFFEWGIPAPVSLMSLNVDIPVIASGGIYNGLHVASSMALGACCAGGANLVLVSAMESADAVKERLTVIREELRTAMMLTGSGNVAALASADRVILGETREWMEGYDGR